MAPFDRWRGLVLAAVATFAGTCGDGADSFEAPDSGIPDSGSDTDTDIDTDTDTDTETDCLDLPDHCCSAECQCEDDWQVCVPGTGDDGQAGVCKDLILDACWTQAECWPGVGCIGVFVCPCFEDCTEDDSYGWCSAGSGGCCEDPGDCLNGEICLEMPVEFTDTCHADLDWPYCWTDGDCAIGDATCQGELLCSCTMDCMSQPGMCSDYED
jgi:hypothetical protein